MSTLTSVARLITFLFILFQKTECTDCKINTISDVSKNCTVVYGDIIVNSTFNYTFPFLSEKLSNIEKVIGRVILKDTAFKNLSFLSSLESIYYKPEQDFRNTALQNCLSIRNNLLLEDLGMIKLVNFTLESIPTDWQFYSVYISENPKLCISLEQSEKWLLSDRVYFPPMIYCGINVLETNSNFIKFKVLNGTKIFCSTSSPKAYFYDLMPLGCQVFEVGIWIKDNSNETELNRFYTALESVETVLGSIAIRNTTLKSLNFKNLVKIYNKHYDDPEYYGGRGTQAINIQNNVKLTDIQFPKLSIIHHFGKTPFVVATGNPLFACTPKTCNVFMKLFRFKVEECGCGKILMIEESWGFKFLGIVPKFNEGSKKSDIMMLIIDSVTCALITTLVYGRLLLRIWDPEFSVSYFQLSMTAYLCICAIEALYSVTNNIQFHDGLDYSWFVGLQFLFISNNENYYFQTINIIYANRISLLLSCCLYRTIAFVRFDYGKGAMCISFLVFIFSNIWSFYGLLETNTDDIIVQGIKFSYGIYLLNWITLAVSTSTMLFLYIYLRKNFQGYPAMVSHQNRLSVAFLLQALLTFVFCGFPDSIFESWYRDMKHLEIVRARRVFAYYYSSTITRWHYLAYAIILSIFTRDMLSRIEIRVASVTSTLKSTPITISRVCRTQKLTMILSTAVFLFSLELFPSGHCTDCTLIFPISLLSNNCTSMSGDIVIDGKNTTTLLENHLQYPTLLQKFSKVEKWSESIRVIHTDFKDFAFFKSLASVETSFPNTIFDESNINSVMGYATLWIESNPNVTNLGMPNLKSVIADVLPTVRIVYGLYIQENTELCLSEEEFWKLRNFQRSFLFGMKICGPVTKHYCSQSSFQYFDMPLGCQILLSGIWLRDLTNTTYQSHLNQAFSTVEEVHGPIVVFRTDLTNLSFPNLHTIRSQFYDGQNDWQWQVLIIRGNYFLTSVEFSKLKNWYHFGREPQLTNSANYIWNYTPENCKLFLKIPFFFIKDTYSNCVFRESIFFFYKLYFVFISFCATFQEQRSVNFFHFEIVTLILLTMSENLFVNIDYIHIFDDNGFAIPFGLRSIFLNRDNALFNQISNVMYANRLALLMSCSLYRPFYLTNLNYEKYALLVSCMVFVVSNVWNLSVMETLVTHIRKSSRCHFFQQNNFAYVLFQMNWLTLIVTPVSGIAVKMILRKTYSTYNELAVHHNRLSFGLFLQALWNFIICGYSDGLNQMLLKVSPWLELVRQWEKFFYWYGGIMMRWHYSMLIIIMIVYLRSTFVKFPIKTTITSVGSSSRAILN
eukprot:NP_509320.4 Insulin/EGF-Receptor L Domain protein [Caenorhabditis elegans]